MKQLWLVLPFALAVVLGCSKDSANTAFSSFPALATAVDGAAPSGLKKTRQGFFAISDDLLAGRISDSALKTALQAMFRGSYGKLSGGNGTGYLNSYLEDLDTRFNEIKTRFASKTPTCMSNTAQTYTIDMSGLESTLATTLKQDLDVQCYDLFDTTNATEQSGSGSGMLFGKSGDNYSLMLTLNTKGTANSGFGYAGRVKNKGKTDEEVELIFGEANQAAYTRMTVAKLKAKPTAKTYELLVVSSQPSGMNPVSGGSPNLGCGFRIISDGTYISTQGVYLGAGSDCNTGPDAFDACYDVDLNSVAGSNCTTLKTSYTIGAAADLGSLTQSDFTGKNDTIFNALQINIDAVKAKATSTSAR